MDICSSACRKSTADERTSADPSLCHLYTEIDRRRIGTNIQHTPGAARIGGSLHPEPKGEGWQTLPTVYDDGGFSGASLDRPALRQLLADVDARRIDCVLVYKVDRLRRSLRDFTRFLC